MTHLYLTIGDALAVITQQGDRWQAELKLLGTSPYCIAVDPSRPQRMYCGTFGQGLWRSADAGETWKQVGEGIAHKEVMAVAVSPLERDVVWAGTEPSALFLSENGGDTWIERTALKQIPSAPTWSFPPRPWTSHVRWIQPDQHEANRLFVGIELGGVMRTLDKGLTWEDRKPRSQPDPHTLVTHPLAPGRVYEAAGGGYAESLDGGETWHRVDAGRDHHYVFGLAVDPANPETIIVSASSGSQQAHQLHSASAHIYRRVDSKEWKEVREGLPPIKGTRIFGLASNQNESGVFYAATHDGNVYRSVDAGLTWTRLDIVYPEKYKAKSELPPAIVVVGV